MTIIKSIFLLLFGGGGRQSRKMRRGSYVILPRPPRNRESEDPSTLVFSTLDCVVCYTGNCKVCTRKRKLHIRNSVRRTSSDLYLTIFLMTCVMLAADIKFQICCWFCLKVGKASNQTDLRPQAVVLSIVCHMLCWLAVTKFPEITMTI